MQWFPGSFPLLLCHTSTGCFRIFIYSVLHSNLSWHFEVRVSFLLYFCILGTLSEYLLWDWVQDHWVGWYRVQDQESGYALLCTTSMFEALTQYFISGMSTHDQFLPMRLNRVEYSIQQCQGAKEPISQGVREPGFQKNLELKWSFDFTCYVTNVYGWLLVTRKSLGKLPVKLLVYGLRNYHMIKFPLTKKFLLLHVLSGKI